MVVNEQDVYARLDIAMLEGVIEQNYVCSFGLVVLCQVLNAPCPLAINCHRHLWVFLLDLIGLVANHLHRRFCCSQHIAATLALIASAQHGHVELVFQQLDEIFHMRGLSGAANSDVTHRDNGYGIRLALQDIHIEEQVSELHAQTVQPTQWQQLLI